MSFIPAEQKVGNLIVIYTPGIDMMGISREGMLCREHIEEVKRLDGEGITDWHARAISRAEELQK